LELNGFFKGQIVDDAKYMSQVKWMLCSIWWTFGNFGQLPWSVHMNDSQWIWTTCNCPSWLSLVGFTTTMGFSFHMGLENANKM
jgi:hypothetical protein